MVEMNEIISIVESGTDEQRAQLTSEVSASWDRVEGVVRQVLENPTVRRWARGNLLDRLPPHGAADLAELLLGWPDDFRPERRDRSTDAVVGALSEESLWAHLPALAASNSSGALWARIAEFGQDALLQAVWRVLASDDVVARETTLHLLVLDPYGPEYLSLDQQGNILIRLLDDTDPEIRGLAAEVIAADLPDVLLDRWDSAPLDDSERMRMAFWQVALAYRFDEAVESAGQLVLDPTRTHDVRRTAVLALAERVATRTISPILQALLTGDDAMLAEDAAQIMWRFHRAPDIATAASQSRFESVRETAERLLHPEMGSPAAGGSRPGDPTKTTDIFEQLLSEDEPDT